MKVLLYEREWEQVDNNLRHNSAQMLIGGHMAWADPRGAVFDTRYERGLKQFECAFRATHHTELEQVEWLVTQGLELSRDSGVLIGVADPLNYNGPLQFRASGIDLKSAMLDLAGRLR